MSSEEEIEMLAKFGADSVYNYIERTAEVLPDGVRWQTLGFEDEPVYHYRIFGGCAGISFFLADYYKTNGVDKAKDLALGCCKWCSSFEPKDNIKGLLNGQTGVALAWLHLANVLQDHTPLRACHEHAEFLLNENLGPQTEIFCGVAGDGLFLYKLWEATQEERYREGIIRFGEWLAEHIVRNEHGSLWPWHLKEEPTLFGFAHGNSGIAHFFLLLYKATQNPRWQNIVYEVIETLKNNAIPDHGGLHWPRIPNPGKNEIIRCQWCNGSPGIGLFFIKAYEILDDNTCLQTAKAAGETTFRYGDIRKNPTQCHGLAGNAELFIELYRVTHEQMWLERAFDFARQALAYRTVGADGDLWQADEAGHHAQDFCYGAAGTGHFFLRLLKPSGLQMPLS